MSTPFDVRQWASQAGITTTGGFAVVAECVTLDELQRFAQIAMEAAAIDLVKKNNRLDCIASELQDTCHKQAQQIAELEEVAQRALDAIHYWHWEGETPGAHDMLVKAHDALRDVLHPAAEDQK